MKMTKRISALFCVLLLCVCAVLPVAAAPARLADNASLLTEEERETVSALLDVVSERCDADIVVVTTDSLDGKTPRDFADDFFDQNGFGTGEERSGVLLMVCMSTRDWYISTSGTGMTAVTAAGREYIAKQFLGDLGGGFYADAFTTFANECDDLFARAAQGDPYDDADTVTGGTSDDYDNYDDDFVFDGTAVAINLLIALVIAFVIALIVTGVMRAKLKTVRRQAAADSYVKAGSLNITESSDLFLYSHLDRRERPKDDDHGGSDDGPHISSGGVTHDGGGGKF